MIYRMVYLDGYRMIVDIGIYPVVRERLGAFGVFIFPIGSLFNGELRSYLEFPNHLIDIDDYRCMCVFDYMDIFTYIFL